MSITTYAELKTAIAEWANKTNLTAKLPDFVTLAEAKFNRLLRTRWQEATLAPTGIDADFHIAVPSNAIAVKSFWREADPTWRIEQKDLSYVIERRQSSGLAKYLAWEGENWTFDGTADDVTGQYYVKINALSDSNTTNWLLTSNPDLYLFAGLEACAKYLRDFDGAVAWAAQAQGIIDTLNSISTADQISGGPLVARSGPKLGFWSKFR